MLPNPIYYLKELCDQMAQSYPENRTIQLICHGHSVPSGYFATPFVDPFHAYPHLLHRLVKERFPFAVINVIVTGVGGENSEQGAARFEKEVLCHRPDLITLDYGLNDRGIGLAAARKAWLSMIEQAKSRGIPMILLTPSWEQSCFEETSQWQALLEHVRQIRELAAEQEVGLADSFAAFQRYVDGGGSPQDLLSHVNHPNEAGHRLIAGELSRWFIAR